MKVSLPPELEKFVIEQVQSGAYLTPDEVVRAALWEFREWEAIRQAKLEALRKEIAIGIEQADRGEVAPLDIDAIKAEGRRRLAAERAKK
jgi:antitoxin ParD1/3/4